MEEVAILVVNIGSMNFDEDVYLESAKLFQQLLELDGIKTEIYRDPEEAGTCQTLIFFSKDDESIAFAIKEKFPDKNVVVTSGWTTKIVIRKGVVFLPKSYDITRDFLKMYL